MSSRRFLVTYGVGLLLTAVLVTIAVVEVVGVASGSGPTVKTLQGSIESGLSDQLIGQATLAGGFPPNITVTCPRHASLIKGSAFSCTADVETTFEDPNAQGGFRIDSKTLKLRVTMLAGGKARWVVAGQS